MCLWFLARNKAGHKGGRDHRGETLFIDARKLGSLIDRIHRDLVTEDITRIANTYHTWCGDKSELSDLPIFRVDETKYEDISGFCKSVTIDEIREKGYILTPGRYVGAAEKEEDSEPLEQRIEYLTQILENQFTESNDLQKEIRSSLQKLDYERKLDI